MVVVDTDWASLSIDSELVETEQTLSNYRNKQVLTNGFAGRSLYRLFKLVHFEEINIQIFPLFVIDVNLFYALSAQKTVENQAVEESVISQKKLDEWRLNLKYKMEKEILFACVHIIMVFTDKS